MGHTVAMCVAAAAVLATVWTAGVPAGCKALPAGADVRRCFTATAAQPNVDKAASGEVCAASGGSLPRVDSAAVVDTLGALVRTDAVFARRGDRSLTVRAFVDGTASDSSRIDDVDAWHFDNGTMIPHALWYKKHGLTDKKVNEPRAWLGTETCAIVLVCRHAAGLGCMGCSTSFDLVICEYNTGAVLPPAPATTSATTSTHSMTGEPATSATGGGGTSSQAHNGTTSGSAPPHHDHTTAISIAVGASLGVIILLLAAGGTVTCVCVQRRAANNRDKDTLSSRLFDANA